MKKIFFQSLFFIIGTQIFCCAVCYGQREKIDSLKKVLPSLYHSARIDCLNGLSDAYLNSNRDTAEHSNDGYFRLYADAYLKLKSDTAKYYATLAYAEAKKINYIYGIAESLSYRGKIELSNNNFSAAAPLSNESINWYSKTANKKGLADTYLDLSLAFLAQSFYTEAIKILDTAYEYCKKTGDRNGMGRTIIMLGNVYAESGNYEKAFELHRKGFAMAIENNDDNLKRSELIHMAVLFIEMGDYTTALDYYGQAYSIGIPDTFNYLIWYAELYTRKQQYDSAKYYYSLADTSDNRSLRFYLVSTGECYLAQGQYSKALPNFLRSLAYTKEKNDHQQVMRILIDIAKTYLALQNSNAAFQYGRQGLNMANQTGSKLFIRDGNQILYSVYDARHQTDSAYHYYREYIKMKDSILNDQVKAKLIAYGPQQKIALLNKEKGIQQVQLQKESLWRKFLITGIIALIVLAIIIVRVIILKRKNETHKRKLAENELQIQKLESEKTKSELQQQATELEMQALRAQMNPHFIFNSLNSINRFILKNNKAQASEYLTKFSKLVRMILQNSQASLITLESELESLNLYLEMEVLRFDYHFEYKISVPNDLDIEVLKVPPLILQPYVENAIWHGLMHKEEKGQLDIEVCQGDSQLFFKITDDGIGRKQAAALNSKSATKHKSVGLKITAGRIAMMHHANETESSVTINDLVNDDGSAAGTEVIIIMPVMYD